MKISPIKVSKDKKEDILISQYKMMTHYSREFVSPQPFNDNISGSCNSGTDIKRFCLSDNYNGIIVHDFLSVKKAELNFERRTFQSKIFTIEDVINECA